MRASAGSQTWGKTLGDGQMTKQARPDVGAGDEWAVEAEVLSEAAATLGEWAKRLPEDSCWREAFAGIASAASQSVALHERLHRQLAA